MNDTPRTDAEVFLLFKTGDDEGVSAEFTRKLERENIALRNEVARLNNQTMWVCSCGGTDCAGQRENAALREVLRMAKRYVPPQAVTNEWKTKPVSECRLLDKIESVLAE